MTTNSNDVAYYLIESCPQRTHIRCCKLSKDVLDSELFVHHLFREGMMCSALLSYCARLHRLSSGEEYVITMLVQGVSPAEIASMRETNIKTISTLKRNAFLKLKVSSDIELIHYMYFLKNSPAFHQTALEWCLSANRYCR